MAPFIRSLASLASLALWFGPARFRTEYGSAVVADFAALLDAEQRRRGPAAMLVLWMRGVGDAVKTARREQQLAAPPPRTGRPFGDLSGDLRSALRAARRSPGFSITIVLTLVFGLGLASAIFAFGDGYLFRPIPYANPDELYLVRASDVRGEFLRGTEAEALRAGHLAPLGFVDGVKSAAVGFGTMRIGDRLVRVNVDGVGENFGQLLGVPLVAGRHFTAEDHRSGGPVPVWLTHRFWQREFGGDPGVIGRRIPMSLAGRDVQPSSNRELEVVGITDPRITTFNTRFGRSNALPDAFAPGLIRPPASNVLATPIVRLQPDWSVERATAAIAAALQSIAPGKDGKTRTVRLDPLADELGKTGRSTAVLFIIGAGLALLLVTINLVHLLLTRGAARAAEIATRAAIGASRWRIARLFLVESLAHGVVGIAGGLMLGAWMTSILAARIPTRGSEMGTLALVVMRFDVRVIAVAIVMGLVVAFLGGVWPAWRAVRRPLAVVTRSASGVGARVSPRVSRAILTSEVAISTIVLMGAIFSGIGLWRFIHQPLGFDLDGRFSVAFPDSPGRSAPASSTDWLALVEALRRVDGVKALAASVDEVRKPVRVGERVFEPRQVLVGTVGVQYFAAAGNHLVQGRFPDDGEIAASAPVAVVDERFAKTAWPSASALGSRVQVGETTYDVVGVVENPKYSLVREVPPVVFVPAPPVNERQSVTVFAPELSAADLTQRFSSVMSTAAPGFYPNVSPLTFERMFDDELANARFQQPIIIVLGVFAFTVAGVGLFGLVAYLVEQRTRDFGIRLALGARARDIRRHLAAESLWPASVGLAIGLAAAWGLQGVMRATMFGWESSGPLAAAAVGGVVIAVAMTAIAGPARRVLRIDPAITLRTE